MAGLFAGLHDADLSLANEDYDLEELNLLIAASDSSALQASESDPSRHSDIAPDQTNADPSSLPSTTAGSSSQWNSPNHTSHSRKKDPEHVRRPPNAFLLFRSDFWANEKIKVNSERDNRMISVIAGAHWRNLSEQERAPYKLQAELEKQRHTENHPDYKYAPGCKKEKVVKRRTSRSHREGVRHIKVEQDASVKLEQLEDASVPGDQVEKLENTVPAIQLKQEPVDTLTTIILPARSIKVASKKSRRTRPSRPSRPAHPQPPPAAIPRTPEFAFPPSPQSQSEHDQQMRQVQHEYTIAPNEPFVYTADIPPLDLNDSSEAVRSFTSV